MLNFDNLKDSDKSESAVRSNLLSRNVGTPEISTYQTAYGGKKYAKEIGLRDLIPVGYCMLHWQEVLSEQRVLFFLAEAC